jgi:carboxyl-terminal processing protease
LPWDVVPPAPYERLNRVAPYAAHLREMSARRVAAEKDFGYLAGDVARIRQTLATKSVSLNEAERRRELAQDKARHAEREQEERALRPTRPTTYAITLENASSPGLPPPIVRTTPVDKASSADDITLDEAERVLSDYVGLLS